MYYQETQGVGVSVTPNLIAQDEQDGKDLYLYSYEVEIKNNTKDEIALKSRHWIIRDGEGKEEHVIGDGVIGEQPVIAPGENYTYTSGCPLNTATGSMRGQYEVEKAGKKEKVKIPLFFLRPDLPKDETSWLN